MQKKKCVLEIYSTYVHIFTTDSVIPASVTLLTSNLLMSWLYFTMKKILLPVREY